ncbi:MAG: U32 family peptidase [Oscillospiraceae bacterium]|nr:U32 family peptidase [Oscillospiraceae bacterium]
MSETLSRLKPMSKPKPELLAPAGSMESLTAAVRCGADAVYAGGKLFSARANASNFSDEELAEAVQYCHLHGVKLYRAMNTVVFAEEVGDFLSEAKKSAEMGVDGLIVQDLGMARLVRECLPDMKLNASTQMTIHTPEGASFAQEMGFSRVVAARELSLKELEAIIATGVETEVFIHGALCMSVSGQCYMSAMIGSRSANRGMCAQACRLPFGRDYDLSLKDLCGIPHIKALADMGAASFKIEGRMKRPEYVAAAVAACRAALDGGEPDLDVLRSVFSRSGFTDGYLTGKLGKDMFGYRTKEDVTAAETVLPKLRESYRKETKAADGAAEFYVHLAEGEPTRLEMSCGDITVSAEGDVPERAVKRPADDEYLQRQLDRLGDTVYSLRSLKADIGEGLTVSAAAVNALRREAVRKMDEARILNAKPVQRYIETDLTVPAKFSGTAENSCCPPKIRVRIYRENQLAAAIASGADEIVLPIEMCGKVGESDGRFIAALPRFCANEAALCVKLKDLREKGFERLLCTNIAYIKIGRELGFKLSGGFGLNIANPWAALAAREAGLSDITASFECRTDQLKALRGVLPTAVIVYGRLPLMLTRNCPAKGAINCKSCTGNLLDRTGRTFPIICGNGSSEIFNCVPLMMTDKAEDIPADIYEIDLTVENPDMIKYTADCLKQKKKALEKDYTRGLYYRGVCAADGK